MAALVSRVEVNRPPGEVFSYLADPARFPEWQLDATRGGPDGDGPSRVGGTYRTTRRIRGIVPVTTTSVITEHDPPRTFAARGAGGPVRETVRYTVEALSGGASSVVMIQLEFDGYGLGKVLVPLVIRRQARKQLARNSRELQTRLERRPAQAWPGR